MANETDILLAQANFHTRRLARSEDRQLVISSPENLRDIRAAIGFMNAGAVELMRRMPEIRAANPNSITGPHVALQNFSSAAFNASITISHLDWENCPAGERAELAANFFLLLGRMLLLEPEPLAGIKAYVGDDGHSEFDEDHVRQMAVDEDGDGSFDGNEGMVEFISPSLNRLLYFFGLAHAADLEKSTAALDTFETEALPFISKDIRYEPLVNALGNMRWITYESQSLQRGQPALMVYPESLLPN